MSKVTFNEDDYAQRMYGWATDLFPLNRSITGLGVRQTLEYLKEILPEICVFDVPSGTEVFDWTVPDEWEIQEGWVENEKGERIIDFKNNNLHVVGYSTPVDCWLELEELNTHLHSRPDLPDAIPYVTSYYERTWGFCVSHKQRMELRPGKYHAVIKSRHFTGVLNYDELLIPGETDEEIFLSTYLCHPSMANNELSGPVVTAAISLWLMTLKKRRYSYRVVFVPETIGSIVYLSRHLKQLQKRVVAGFNVTCVGDNNAFSFLPSKTGDTLADKAAKYVLDRHFSEYTTFAWTTRGSDERQYCAPGVDLPVASIMRSKYGTYKEYHTSLDDLNFISPDGLRGGFEAIKMAIDALEKNISPVATKIGEPMLSKHGLYPTLSQVGSVAEDTKLMMDIITYSDGTKDLIDLSIMLDTPLSDLFDKANLLIANGVIKQ